MQISASRHFTSWLDELNISVGLSTYDAGKIILAGRSRNGGLVANERNFRRAMGLWSDGQTLWAATAFQLWRFANVFAPGQTEDDQDRLFVPRCGYTTGDLDIHDVVMAGGQVQFAATLFSTIATLSETASFKALWRPPFISALAAEDRCHLNGIAVRDGQVRYATAIAVCDVAEGWRDHRRDGGVVIDVESNEIIARGLSMPHSPRWHQGKLWLLDSGNGYLGYLDAHGQFERVTFCPGYARGLAFAGDYALTGLSRPREQSFKGLALDENLAARGAKARTGLAVIDTRNGNLVHSLHVDERIRELYDVVVLPGVRRARMLGFKTDEVHHTVTIEGQRDLWRATRTSGG
jgi:uncharacterized protein (TIGR03032 family)